jgi:hypothetical protein
MRVEDELEDLVRSPANLRMYADGVKRDVKEALKNAQEKKNSINAEVKKENDNFISENRTKLKNALSEISKNGFLRSQVSEEEIIDVYNNIINGTFTEQINNDPQLVAKFGVFLKKESEISNALKGPTYGQGVKDTFDKFNSYDKSNQSTVSKTMERKSSGGQEVSDTISRFGNNVVESKQSQENNFVAGKGRYSS